ncbi:MAG: lipid-binding protein, partial [Flavobacterium sp.]
AKDFKNLTFAGEPESDEMYTGSKVTVSNGKILKNAATSFGGHVVDSIYFEAEFDWDPGIVYKFSGHKRTGFKEDEL